ncbi:hypothetical protein FE697_015330 [Mumia zhuanghuii]|uniref:Uncharacterized protein n=2 Tax=Mumia TaxID=1546255 RepID=A0ABW1QRX3_9ACTN|nr:MULTISPECIES: hypothetical protein [Mumia]KAA1422504.1 hypothetical protein FE697_015330 [Mumia zhuanghuii]
MTVIAQLDTHARRIVGKPFADCTLADLDRLNRRLLTEAIATRAAARAIDVVTEDLTQRLVADGTAAAEAHANRKETV